jgi:hypothetical protein
MDAGPGILYPAQAVDGLVHQMCILFFNSELYFRHFVFFLLSTLGPQGWIVSQRSFIVGARSLNEKDLHNNLAYFKVPEEGIESVRSKLVLKIFDEYANILKDIAVRDSMIQWATEN